MYVTCGKEGGEEDEREVTINTLSFVLTKSMTGLGLR